MCVYVYIYIYIYIIYIYIYSICNICEVYQQQQPIAITRCFMGFT